MNMPLVYKYTKSNFNYTEKKIDLPNEILVEIGNNWDKSKKKNKSLHNGEIFVIENVEFIKGQRNFNLVKSTYSHYLYSFKNNFVGNYGCRSVAVNLLPITMDGYYVLALMNVKTSMPNTIKFIGGAISNADLEIEKFNLYKSIRRETLEEIGIDLSDKKNVQNCEPIYFLTRKNLSTVIVLFKAVLELSKDELQDRFDKYIDRNIKSEIEIQKIIFIKDDEKSLNKFMLDNKDCLIEYLPDTFDSLLGKIKVGEMPEAIF